MMISWSERVTEEAYLLNPSFCALLLWSSATDYKENKGIGLPFPLCFLVIPIILHKNTREALPRTISTPLATWIIGHSEALVGFINRTQSLVPFIREALLFGLSQNLFEFDSQGNIAPASRPKKLTRYSKDATAEARECLNKAAFVGRWFAESGTSATIMALWGVKP